MADYNESRNRSRIDYPDDGAVHTRRVTADEVAHRNAYVRGRDDHAVRQHGRQIRDINRHIEQERIDRDRNKTAIGLLLGIALASAIGLLAAIFYFASRKDEARIVPVPAPTVQPQTSDQPTSNQPASTQPQSTQRTTIIERLREVPVERPETEVAPATPQQQIVVPAPTQSNAPTDTPANVQSGSAPNQSTATPNQPVQQPTTTQDNNSQVQNGASSNTLQPSENSVQPQNGQGQAETESQAEPSEANSYQIEIPAGQ